MTIFDADECPQGSPLWWDAKRGIPSASNFVRILTPVKAELSKQAEDYIDELIGDIAGFDPPWLTESRTKPPTMQMQHGLDMEEEARRYYAMERDVSVQLVGGCMTDDGRFWCSPDGLIDPDGGVEIKCPERKTQVRYLRYGVLPPEYKCQVHGALIVTGRKWWDFISYAPGLSPLLLRVEPDDFTEKLREGLERFWTLYQATLAKVHGPEHQPA